MGKKQHQKDKLYLTTTEWKESYGGHKDDQAARLSQAVFRRLPFTHCSLSFLPFENPVCTTDGTVFDLTSIVPFLKKHGINPVTGDKLEGKSLIHLKYHKNSAGEYHCPITFKTFTATSHIVAIKPSGNVYSYEAIEELNLRPKFFKDLMTDEPFTRQDIITLQDPKSLDKFNMSKFHHVQYNLKAEDEEEERRAREDPKYTLKRINAETRETLAQLEKDYKAPEKKAEARMKADEVNAAHFSTGQVAAGFTSTVMPVITTQEAAITDEDTLRYRRVKKKGYVRLITTHGPLNVELHSEMVPKACENFITHCKNGYYNDTIFHRLIKNFMVQGGDPTGTGQGGESIWGKPFKDEIVQQFHHSGRGIVSMANAGSNTNGSQFFITFRSCKHLDGKHTIFGQIVGGMDTLTAIEKVETDKKTDKPLEEVKILNAQVFVDPFQEANEALSKERDNLKKKQEKSSSEAESSKKNSFESTKPVAYKQGVGKYIKPAPTSSRSTETAVAKRKEATEDTAEGAKKKSKLVRRDVGDFSAW